MYKQSNENSSINRQKIIILKHLYKSKSLDTWHSQSIFNLSNNYDKNISSNSKLIDLNKTSNNIKDIFLNSNLQKKNNFRHMTINLNTDMKIAKDIESYRNQLYNTHGSIQIQTYSPQSKQCCCSHHQSNKICEQMLDFENEIFQNNFVEYIYEIRSNKNKNIVLK